LEAHSIHESKLISNHPTQQPETGGAKINSEQAEGMAIIWGKKTGIGLEFEQYRSTNPGDDPKRIDWKYLSAPGKHMIKESQN